MKTSIVASKVTPARAPSSTNRPRIASAAQNANPTHARRRFVRTPRLYTQAEPAIMTATTTTSAPAMRNGFRGPQGAAAHRSLRTLRALRRRGDAPAGALLLSPEGSSAGGRAHQVVGCSVGREAAVRIDDGRLSLRRCSSGPLRVHQGGTRRAASITPRCDTWEPTAAAGATPAERRRRRDTLRRPLPQPVRSPPWKAGTGGPGAARPGCRACALDVLECPRPLSSARRRQERPDVGQTRIAGP
jgi:hypothetical protein